MAIKINYSESWGKYTQRQFVDLTAAFSVIFIETYSLI